MATNVTENQPNQNVVYYVFKHEEYNGATSFFCKDALFT